MNDLEISNNDNFVTNVWNFQEILPSAEKLLDSNVNNKSNINILKNNKFQI